MKNPLRILKFWFSDIIFDKKGGAKDSLLQKYMELETLFVVLFGISIGSFVNVLIYRIPKGESIVLPASHCPKCHVKLKFYHNIPILSWFFLRGKCAFCNSPISSRYPIVEGLVGAIFVAIYLKFGISAESLILGFIFSLLTALSLIDIEHRAVPDSLNLSALTLAIIYTLEPHQIFISFQNAMLFAGGFAFLRFYVSYFAGREAMGEGDIMIAGTIGAILGATTGIFAIFLSSLLTLPAMLIFREKEMPYIPFLATALFLTLIFQESVIKLLNTILGGTF